MSTSRLRNLAVTASCVLLVAATGGCALTTNSASNKALWDPDKGANNLKSTTCAPSFCADSLDDMTGWTAASVPASQKASTPLAASTVSAFSTPRLFAATDEAGNRSPNQTTNDYQDGFQGAGVTGNVYNYNQWAYTGMFYYYNHSPMAVPPTGYINAAHRNGVPILGVLTGDCSGCADMNNSFYANPAQAASQLITMARTYGFDGWLVDAENGVDSSAAINTIQQMNKQQASSANPVIAMFYAAFACDLGSNGEDQQTAFQAAGYYQSDYCQGSPQASNSFVTSQKSGQNPTINNPFTTASASYMYSYATGGKCQSGPSKISNGSNCLNTANLFASNVGLVKNGTQFYQSPALYAVGWERWGGTGSSNPYNNSATRDQVQQAHRDLFVGQGATQTTESCTASVNGQGPNPNSVASIVTPAGVNHSGPFVTRFNTGEGDTFAIQGGNGSGSVWNGIGLQDIQPTWVCPQGSGQNAAIAYGPAYDGGSYLNVTGSGVVGLYQTQMAVPAKPTAIVRYKGTTPPLATVKTNGAWVTAQQQSSSSANGWTTSVQTFSGLSGNITQIGVQTSGDSQIGELAVMGAGDYNPTTPPTVQVVNAPASGDVTWSNPSNTWYSNVYGCSSSSASPQLLGRTFASAFNPSFTLASPSVSYPQYAVQPVSQSGIAASVTCTKS